MSMVVVGVSDCRVSNDTSSVLVTYALGSCIAVSLHDPVAKVGGMLHYMLPESSINLERAGQNPAMFADTGIPALFRAVYGLGAHKNRLVVRLAGGAQVINANGLYQIGRRNYLAAKKLLWKEGVLIFAEAVGGEVSRTVRLDVASGKLYLREGAVAEIEMSKNGSQQARVGSQMGGSQWQSAS